MKAKKYEQILREVLTNHLEVHCQMKADIMLAFKTKVIIEKYKIKSPVISDCESESIKESIKEHLNRNTSVGLIFFNKRPV